MAVHILNLPVSDVCELRIVHGLERDGTVECTVYNPLTMDGQSWSMPRPIADLFAAMITQREFKV